MVPEVLWLVKQIGEETLQYSWENKSVNLHLHLPPKVWHYLELLTLDIQSTWVHFVQYIPRNMHTVFALLCFVVVIHWLIFPYPSGLLNWHCGNLTIAPVPAKQPWWIWINTSCEFIMNDCITTTKQSTTKPCAYFLGCTEYVRPGPGCEWVITPHKNNGCDFLFMCQFWSSNRRDPWIE